MQQRYRPSNAVLVLSGSLTDARSHQELIDLVTDQFGSWEDQPVPGIEPITESQDAIRSYADVRKTEQAHFCLGFRTFGYDDQRRYPLSVLAAMLGGGMASRLFTEVRERRGLCYYISTGREFYHDVGNIVTQAGVSTSVEKIQEAVDVTLDQHRQFVQGQFSDEELTRAKEMIKGRIVLSLEDSRSMASFMGTRWLLQGDAQTPEQVMEAISAVTKDQVQEVARFCFQPERLQFAMIGPVAADQIKIAYNT
jgi:predicted Zn-dependent peptidase